MLAGRADSPVTLAALNLVGVLWAGVLSQGRPSPGVLQLHRARPVGLRPDWERWARAEMFAAWP